MDMVKQMLYYTVKGFISDNQNGFMYKGLSVANFANQTILYIKHRLSTVVPKSIPYPSVPILDRFGFLIRSLC